MISKLASSLPTLVLNAFLLVSTYINMRWHGGSCSEISHHFSTINQPSRFTITNQTLTMAMRNNVGLAATGDMAMLHVLLALLLQGLDAENTTASEYQLTDLDLWCVAARLASLSVMPWNGVIDHDKHSNNH